MTKPRKSPHIVIAALLLLGQVGCASVPPRLPQDVQSQLGVIGVVSVDSAPRTRPPFVYEKPAKGSAASGAAQGAGLGAIAGLAATLFYGVAGIVLVPYAIVTEAYHEAATALPAEVVEQAEAALKNAFAESKVQQAMSEPLVELIRARSETRVVGVTDPGSCSSWRIPWWRVDCRALAKDLGIDTVLEIGPVTVGLGRTGLGSPNLRLRTTADVWLFRVNAPTESSPQPSTGGPLNPHSRVGDSPELLLNHQFSHDGEQHPFTTWAENDARLFRQELRRSIEALRGQIVDALFCAGSSSPCKEAIREKFDQPGEEGKTDPGALGDVGAEPAAERGADERAEE